MSAPEHPIGPWQFTRDSDKSQWISDIAALPKLLRSAVEKLNADQLNTVYRSWTVRQIIHHLADSHCNAYTRFKLGLTEENPTIKPYDETAWSALAEPQNSDIALSLSLLDGLHGRWAATLQRMTDADFTRTIYHPERQAKMSLMTLLSLYAHHGKHHLAQIHWLASAKSW